MMKTFITMPKTSRKQAFTLIEMLVVIGVMLILLSIAIPNFIGVMDRAKVTQCKTLLIELKNTVAAYNTDTRQWPESGSEHLYFILGGYAPFSAKSSKKYNPPYMEFDAGTVGADDYITKEYANNQMNFSSNKTTKPVKAQDLRTNNPIYRINWRPILDPWRRPVVYISPNDLKKRFNDDETLEEVWVGLIAMDSEVAVNDNNRPANVPFSLNSGQFWSAGRDGITAPGDGDAATVVKKFPNAYPRGLFQPGGLSGSDQRDNDNDGQSDASDIKARGANYLAEDDVNSW